MIADPSFATNAKPSLLALQSRLDTCRSAYLRAVRMMGAKGLRASDHDWQRLQARAGHAGAQYENALRNYMRALGVTNVVKAH